MRCSSGCGRIRAKRNKYRNIQTVVDGIKFASKREAARYSDLKLLERAGEISNIELQPTYQIEIYKPDGKYHPVKIRSEKRPNGTRTRYTADFRYQCLRTGRQIVEDVKGIDTQVSRLRRAVVECIYSIEIDLI